MDEEKCKGGDVVDSALEHIGFGKYQVLNYAFVCLTVGVTATCSLAFVFTARDAAYRCSVPHCESTPPNFNETWLANAIPHQDGRPQKCEKYTNEDSTNSCSFDNTSIEKCSGWVYAEEKTMVEEFNIPCEEWKISLVGTVNSAGQSLSLFLSGYLSDKYGRRNVMAIMTATLALIGVLQSFCTDYWSFITLEFLNMAASNGAYVTAFILGIETLSAKHRPYGCTLLEVMVTTGSIVLGFAAWTTQYWRYLLRAISIPSLIAVLSIFTIPESIRWLHVKNKNKEFSDTIKRASKMNNVNIEPLLSSITPLEIVNAEEESSFLEIFRSPRMLIRFVICLFCWFGNVLVFNGLSLYSVTITSNDNNPYINFIYVSSVEYFSIIAYLIILRFAKRRIALFICLFCSGVFCLIYATVLSMSNSSALIIYLISKTFITTSLMMFYIYTSEIFPTSLRNSSLSICSVGGRVGGALASQVPLLMKIHKLLPMTTYGVVACLSAFALLKLPETRGKTLPDTIKDAEKL